MFFRPRTRSRRGSEATASITWFSDCFGRTEQQKSRTKTCVTGNDSGGRPTTDPGADRPFRDGFGRQAVVVGPRSRGN